MQSLADLSSSSSFFLAHQVLLVVLWSLLLLLSAALCCRVHVTRSDLFSFSKSNYYMPILLLLLLLTPTSNILYNAIAPLSSSSLLSTALSTCWLFLSDLFLVASFSFLYPYTRDLLLLSPVISDAQYNSFVSSDVPRVIGLLVLCSVLGVLVAAAVSAVEAMLLVYVCVALAYVGVFGAVWMWQLYGLAARDVRAVRRISIAPLPSKSADGPVLVARNSWVTTENGGGSTRLDHASSISIASTAAHAPHSSLSSSSNSPQTVERPHTATRPSESPKSTSASNSLAPPTPPMPVAIHVPTLHTAPSSHSISISPFPASTLPASSPVTGRRVSMVVAVEAGCKPVKTFAAERVNVRRLMLLHCALAVTFVAIYAVHAAQLASSFTQTADDVIALHLVRGLIACLWSLLFVWTLWPSKRQVQKARDKQERRNSIRRNSMLPVGATELSVGDGKGPLQAAKSQSPMLTSKVKGAEEAVDALQLAVDGQANESLEDDEEDDVESSRERALVLMSAAAHYMQQQQPPSRGGSPALVASASPTASPFAHSAFATNFPPMPPLALSSNDPTSLLEPAALPMQAASSTAPFASTASSARVRHSLPAIHVEPLLLRSLMQALTEPTTPQSAHDPAGILSPPGMLRDLPSPLVINRRSSEGAMLPVNSAPITIGAVGASSRAVAARRPTRASQTSTRSHSSLVGAVGVDGGQHERQRSRPESIRKDVISPRTNSSRGSRQRIFTPTSVNHTNAVDG